MQSAHSTIEPIASI